ncbi:aryl-alcohol dehydrogenase-like predicted oxidoreductase [Paenibacillus taihuensis]|uniref:Aryl-alcohol dehydrogenase-like predicted oxidoreductase n=1 Tax=Paenibacillus taihuensis TaxID=1156355 RepID=A0A3D9R1P7_9BACL|nr:aldo/keto reductase [Paenibacillus taihuensis]REE67618.1 aryl-alcohol dehydrogenase-like predicted oxidoreductase [Paenibacillus taihuensis]
MKNVDLGSQGLKVSQMGLGCMGMSTYIYGPSDDEESLSTLQRAIELGVTFFDTAETYGMGHNEQLLGRAFAGIRDRVVIATKVGFGFGDDGKIKVVDGKRVVDGRPANVVRAIEGSLRRLQMDYIDLVYLHRIDPTTPIEETIGAMSKLVAEGRIGHIGLSEAAASTIRRAHAVHPITAVQTEYSLFERGVEANGVLDTVRELGIGFVPYSPLGRGFLTGQLKMDELHKTDFRNTDPRLNAANLKANLRIVEAIRQIAESRGVKPAQLALAWTIAKGSIPIPGTRRLANLEENVASTGIVITPDEVNMLDEAAPIGITSGERYTEDGMSLVNR